MRIIPIASGKGGVGKSLLTANLALALGDLGRSVIAVDLDLGGSNLHLLLGSGRTGSGIGRFLSDQSTDFNTIVQATEYRGVRLVAGDGEIPGLANLKSGQKRSLISRLRNLEADYVLLDLGAGTHFTTTDFFLMGRRGIVVTAPTPTAMVNAYLFIKSAVFRVITNSLKRGSPGTKWLDEQRKHSGSLQSLYVTALLEHFAEVEPDATEKIRSALDRFTPRLVMNLLDDPKDAEKVTRLRRSCMQYLAIDPEHLGVMYRDGIQDIALSSRLPVIAYKPQSVLSQAIIRIAEKLVSAESLDEGDQDDGLDFGDTYDEAQEQASADFQSKLSYVEDLLHSGALTQGDLIETVKTQQWELNRLKKENNLLRIKLARAVRAGYQD